MAFNLGYILAFPVAGLMVAPVAMCGFWLVNRHWPRFWQAFVAGVAAFASFSVANFIYTAIQVARNDSAQSSVLVPVSLSVILDVAVFSLVLRKRTGGPAGFPAGIVSTVFTFLLFLAVHFAASAFISASSGNRQAYSPGEQVEPADGILPSFSPRVLERPNRPPQSSGDQLSPDERLVLSEYRKAKEERSKDEESEPAVVERADPSPARRMAAQPDLPRMEESELAPLTPEIQEAVDPTRKREPQWSWEKKATPKPQATPQRKEAFWPWERETAQNTTSASGTASTRVRGQRFETEQQAKEAALQKYPDLGQSGSWFNSTFLRIHEQQKERNGRLFENPDWPMIIAEEVARRGNYDK